MSEEGAGPRDPDERLERQLRDLGPVVLQRKQAEAEGVDALFALALEQRLMGQEVERPIAAASHIYRPTWGQRLRPLWTSLAAASLVAAVLVALLVSRQRPAATTHVAFVPRPSTGDLIRNYPSFEVGGGGAGMEVPITSPIMTAGGGAYPVRLRLTTSHLPADPMRLPAFRLAGPSFDVDRTRQLAEQLGIPASISYWNDIAQVVPRSRARWIVAAVGGPPARVPLHSLAISLRTGQLLYHDLRSARQPHRGAGVRRDRAVGVARAWLRRLGWPGDTMSVLSAGPPREFGATSVASALEVRLGWLGAGPANVPAAVLWVSPGGRIVEALVWPPITKRLSTPTISIDAAWSMVRAGKAPIALHGNVVGAPPTGAGTMMHVSITQVLVTPRRGVPHLVPAFRFAGTVRLDGGQGMHTWYALVPAVGH